MPNEAQPSIKLDIDDEIEPDTNLHELAADSFEIDDEFHHVRCPFGI